MSLPPPPSGSQTMPNPPSRSNSQKESSGTTGWWSAGKSRHTPSKDPPMPAQQNILDAKARAKDNKKNTKGKEQEKEKVACKRPRQIYCPSIREPQHPTKTRPRTFFLPVLAYPFSSESLEYATNLTPSPMRTTDTLSSSPSREAPPLYAQFTCQGMLTWCTHDG